MVPLEQIDTPFMTDEPGARDPASVLAAERLSALMVRHGVPIRQQATLVAHITGISLSQARRKLRGAVWLFGEVLAIAQHFGEALDQVFASLPAAAHQPAALSAPLAALNQAAQFLIDGQALPCQVRLGPQLTPGMRGVVLVAGHDAQGWWVASQAGLQHRGIHGPHYLVDQVAMSQHSLAKPIHIAVVDDDLACAEALGDWFNETGYLARTFTGQLRDGPATEAHLTTMLRTHGVTFFEKPVRPAVLTATIQSKLDRLASAAAGNTRT